MDSVYYRIELDDPAVPSFCTFSKSFYGTAFEISGVIDRMAQSKRCPDTVQAFAAFKYGDMEAAHTVCFHQEKLMNPCKLILKEHFILQNTKHSLTIRLLDRLEDLSKYYEHPLGDIYEYYDEQGELCFNIPYTQLMVYFLRSGELPGGKVVCRAGFPTGVDDLEDYRPEIPTMIISTTGEGDGGEISRLARYLRHPEPGMPQFGPIGRVVERWIGENSNAAERSNDG